MATLQLDSLQFPEKTEVKIELSITATINITAVSAQRKVSKLLLDQVGNLLYGETPGLVAGQRLLWRVPVWLGLPKVGPVGHLGDVDVDVQSGEILFTQQLLNNLAERGDAMAERATHTTN